MEIEKLNCGQVILVRVSGCLDEESVCNLRLAIADYIKRKKNYVVLNLQEVEMMDQVAAGYLLECLQTARRKGGDLKLVKPSTFIEQLFRFVGIWHYFEIYTNEMSAVEAFKLAA